MKYDHPFYEIEIINGTDSSSYYCFSIDDIPDKDVIEEEDINCVKVLFSIEEGDVECFLYYFLKKYYDPHLKYNSHQDIDEDEKSQFYPWLVENVFTYESISKMCDEIMEVAQLLEEDFYNPRLDEVKMEFFIGYMSSNDDPDNINTDRSEEAKHRHVDVVIDFYRRFVGKLRKAMREYPDYCLIGIEGP